MNFYFSFLLLFTFINYSLNEKTCEENDHTCQEKKYEIEYPTLNENLFLNLPFLTKESPELNSSEYLDFRLNKKVINYLKKEKIVPYPRFRFIGRQTGNFLHFMYQAYSKNLPVFFTIDQIIYPFISNTKNLIQYFLEESYALKLELVLTKMVRYAREEKFDNEILNYLRIGLLLLNIHNPEIKDEDDIKSIKDEILNLNNETNNSLYYNLTLMGKIRKINKKSIQEIEPIFKKNDILRQIGHCLRYFQNIVFNLEEELDTVYKIGQLIKESKQEENYKKLKKINRYLFNEEETVFNPLNIYNHINDNYPEQKSLKEIKNLFPKIKDEIILQTELNFMTEYEFYDEESKKNFYHQRNTRTSLFSFSFYLDEWVNYRLTDVKNYRFYSSFFEFIDVVYHSELMRNLTYKRYRGDNDTEGQLYKFRDGINMTKQLIETKNLIENSMEKNKDLWENTFENSFHYLFNLIGHDSKERLEIPNMKFKTFNSLIGAYCHFKQEIFLFQQSVNISEIKNGSIPDIIFESRKDVYQEVINILEKFKERMLEFIQVDATKIKEKISKEIQTLTDNCQLIIYAINSQESGIETEQKKEIIKTAFYYDEETKKYEGWYTNLFKNVNNENDFNLNIYASKHYISSPIPELQYDGVIIYIGMNYPELGAVLVKDNTAKVNKIMLFSEYAGNEYPHIWNETLNYEGLIQLIYNRT